MGSNLLPDTHTTRPYRDFLESVLPGLLRGVSIACEAEAAVSERWSFSAIWGRCLAVTESDFSKKGRMKVEARLHGLFGHRI